MNSDAPPVILFPGRCRTCGRFLLRGRYCHACRGFVAYAVEWGELQMILAEARWAGVERNYLRGRMWEAVRRLPHDAEVLAEVLGEIVELIEEEGKQ